MRGVDEEHGSRSPNHDHLGRATPLKFEGAPAAVPAASWLNAPSRAAYAHSASAQHNCSTDGPIELGAQSGIARRGAASRITLHSANSRARARQPVCPPNMKQRAVNRSAQRGRATGNQEVFAPYAELVCRCRAQNASRPSP